MFKRIGFAAFILVLIFSIGLSSCGTPDAGNAGESTSGHGNQGNGNKAKIGQKHLMIPIVAWSSAIASSNVVKTVLENAGYDVTLKQVTAGAIFASVADGSADAMLTAWLPHTSGDYWRKYKSHLVDLGPSLNKAPLGLVVPKYVKINSIADLKKNTNSIGNKVHWKVVGMDPGAGEMQLTKKVFKKYQLNKWKLQSSSSTAMLAALSDAINSKKPMIVTLWSPHWAFSKWNLKYLKDPKNVYGKPDDIHTIVRQGLKKDAPRAYKILDRFHWTKKQMDHVMVMIQKGMSPAKAAQKWVKNNQNIVVQWTKG